jgi:hypothetical protein
MTAKGKVWAWAIAWLLQAQPAWAQEGTAEQAPQAPEVQRVPPPDPGPPHPAGPPGPAPHPGALPPAPELVPPRTEGLPPLPTIVGEVTAVDDRWVTISLGAREGVELGSHVAFLERAEHESPWERDRERAVVGKVVNLSEKRARVQLGLLEEVRVGDPVQLTRAQLTESRAAPPRASPLMLVEAGIRPFLPLERVSIGAMANLAVTYLPQVPLFLTAEVTPLVGRVGAGPDMGAAGATLLVGYDQRLVGVGLGAGVASYRRYLIDEDDEDWSTYGHLGEAVPRFTFAQHVRAGARDGLHLQLSSAFALVDESWRLAWLRFGGQFRVAAGVWVNPRFLFASQMGVFSTEVGLRLLMRGNGGAGSLFMRPVAGAVGSFDPDANADLSDVSGPGMQAMLWGPMLGVDLEWRL